MAAKPLHTNSNKVFKFSGLGAVTKIFEYLLIKASLVIFCKRSMNKMKTQVQKNHIMIHECYPAAMVPAIAKPSAADFPRPRAESKPTVQRMFLSRMASRNVIIAFP